MEINIYLMQEWQNVQLYSTLQNLQLVLAMNQSLKVRHKWKKQASDQFMKSVGKYNGGFYLNANIFSAGSEVQ